MLRYWSDAFASQDLKQAPHLAAQENRDTWVPWWRIYIREGMTHFGQWKCSHTEITSFTYCLKVMTF